MSHYPGSPAVFQNVSMLPNSLWWADITKYKIQGIRVATPILTEYILLVGVLLAYRIGLRFSSMEHQGRWVTHHFFGAKEGQGQELVPCITATASNIGT